MVRYTNERIKEGVQLLFHPFLKGYREQVNKLYFEDYTENKKNFPLMNPIKFYCLLNNDNSCILCLSSDNDELLFKDFTGVDIPTSIKFSKKFVEENFHTKEYHFLNYVSDLNEKTLLYFSESNISKIPTAAINWGAELADEHSWGHELERLLIDITKPQVKHDIINTDEIIRKVNNPSFEYEFGESIKAYNTGLYFAAAATGGASLENILRIIIERKIGEKALPEKTYILSSLSVLKKNQIIKGRLNARIQAFNTIRNSNAHTNDEPVEKEVVDDLIRIIRDLSLLLD